MNSTPLKAPQMRSMTLDQGARAIAIQNPAARNSTFVLAIASGMRHELPGEEGMLHLLEHLIYQDSAAITSSDREAELNSIGGVLGGHTHMDYTEFYETVLPSDLSGMVARVIEQVFHPAFQPEQINEQIQAVCTERTQRLAPVPGEVLPFPHLTCQYWEDHAHGHDGTGDKTLLSRVSVERLQNLHAKHYRPEHAVLVAFGPQEPSDILEILAEKMGSISVEKTTQETMASHLIEARPSSARNQKVHVPGLPARRLLAATSAADAQTINESFLGDLIVASLLSMQTGLDSSLGIFGPADLTENDLFILVDDTGLELAPMLRLRALATVDDATLLSAAKKALFTAEKSVHDDERLTRTTARDMLLRGSPSFAHELVDRLRLLLEQTARLRKLLLGSTQRLATQPWHTIDVTPTLQEIA
ncbi:MULTISPECIES: insulinase family protein [Micrococcaceae]|uniref:M16 family metallopeptidase n=1 Tax=Micrococcaceae TaxID=1268 RepID=UPI001036B6A2|nr:MULTISPECIES: insulinase family protein [Micrococcaceae]TAP28692.1 insulinase family protein [Arthrobacter sp. S41]UXN32473.1 insulinase family protein [Glutamicibacter sp. M10]